MSLEPTLTQEILHEAFEYKDGNIYWKLRTFRTRVQGNIAGQHRSNQGVRWLQSSKRWRVRVTVNKERRFLGDFKDLELAELVAIEARDKYHKQFANHG